MKSKNSGVAKENENPFLVNDLERVWEEWKKKGKLIGREDLEIKIKRAARLQKSKKDKGRIQKITHEGLTKGTQKYGVSKAGKR